MVLDLYPEIIHEGDLSPDAVGSEVDEICNEIHAACKGVSVQRFLSVREGTKEGVSDLVALALHLSFCLFINAGLVI